jgi:hypothetical protein
MTLGTVPDILRKDYPAEEFGVFLSVNLLRFVQVVSEVDTMNPPGQRSGPKPPVTIIPSYSIRQLALIVVAALAEVGS